MEDTIIIEIIKRSYNCYDLKTTNPQLKELFKKVNTEGFSQAGIIAQMEHWAYIVNNNLKKGCAFTLG